MTGHTDLRRDVVFISAGDHHPLHNDLWRPRNFDVIIACYGSDEEVAFRLRKMADALFEIKGGRFQNLHSLWSQEKIRLESYESVFVADDDVDLSARMIESLFEHRRNFEAWILTPAHLRFLREFDGSVAGWGVDHWYKHVLGPDEPNRYVVDHSVRFFNPRSRADGRTPALGH